VHLFDLNLLTRVESVQGYFSSPFSFAGRKSGNGNGIIHRCFTAQRYPGAAGKGGTEKRKRKWYYPSLFYCAEISWSRRERRDGKAETETVLSDVVLLCRDILEPPGKAGRKSRNGNGYYPSLFYCVEISWSRQERRVGKAETETVLSIVVLLRRDILEPPGKAGRKGGNGNGPGSGNTNIS
jgi:hypothetical protein